MKTIHSYLGIICLLIIMSSCEQKKVADPDALQGVRTAEDDLATILRHPVSMDGIDTVNVAKIDFEETSYNFGEIDHGAVITHQYAFTNTGKVPLLITDARSTCGCTVPEYPEKPIPPGAKGEINVKFDATNRVGVQDKPITVMANTYPSETVIYLQGIVRDSVPLK